MKAAEKGPGLTSRTPSLCVYCGSSAGRAPGHAEAAARLGKLLAARGVRLVYGGGRTGLMGVLADAVVAAGGEAVGVIPRFLDEVEVAHPGLTELVLVDTMHERKRVMFELSTAFAVLPGGLGTLDEAFEIITWKQLRLHDQPILLLNSGGYWNPLVTLLDAVVAGGFASRAARDLVRVVDRVEELLSPF